MQLVFDWPEIQNKSILPLSLKGYSFVIKGTVFVYPLFVIYG